MESTNKPNLAEKEIIRGRETYFVNWNVIYNGELYVYDQVEIEFNKWNYSGVVDALIQYKYPIDKMQAVINNYLLEPENLEYVTVFNEMQAWRKEAKEIAKKALEYGVS
jgi:hypothetical protein